MIHPDRLAEVERRQLAVGAHDGPTEGMCVMEAVAWISGEPWSDTPRCACPVVSAYLRALNDGMPAGERQRLKALIPRLVGSRATTGVEQRRANLAADTAVRVFASRALDRLSRTERAAQLRALDPIVGVGTARAAHNVVRAAAAEAPGAARAASVVAFAAYAADAAARAASTIAYAAYAADAAANAAFAADAWDDAIDLAERMLDITESPASSL
jgi:hypothetical protein